MGVPAAKIEPEPLVSARVKVRAKAQLTLPEEIRRALHISEGDEVEFAVHDDGTITVRGYDGALSISFHDCADEVVHQGFGCTAVIYP